LQQDRFIRFQIILFASLVTEERTYERKNGQAENIK